MIEKTIKFVLAHQNEIEAAVLEKKLDPGNSRTGGPGTGHCQISDPTAMEAVRLATEIEKVVVEYGPRVNGQKMMYNLRWPQRWLRVAKMAEEYYLKSDRKGEGIVFQMYYINGDNMKDIARAAGVGTSLCYIMQKDIMSFCKGVALGLGLYIPTWQLGDKKKKPI